MRVLIACLLLLLVLPGLPSAQTLAPAISYTGITTDTTTTIKVGPGRLHAITINGPVATSVITIYDSASAGGTKIGTITVPSSPQPVTLNYGGITFWSGLTIVTSVTPSDITVSWQ
jgi:hypothetical protein